jgi:arabinan endo-1,5-alpha-L-arabinosidase
VDNPVGNGFRCKRITDLFDEEKVIKVMPLLLTLVAVSVVSCGESKPVMPGAKEKYNDPPAPEYTAVSVHDPSVFLSGNNEFYVMGSHLAAAKTADFINWVQVTQDWKGVPNSFYPQDNPDAAVQTVQSQITDVMRGSQFPISFYAGDIHRMPDGRFFQYYCMTSSWYCSAIGLSIADNIEGPYITQGLIVRSGEAADNSMSPDGTSRWHMSMFPNCIDPQAFFDKDGGNFYLVYGSWSGGIFIYELNPQTGLLKEDSMINAENAGYGKKLIRNSHSSIEGPYIIYSPETQYYYLFVSYGGLAANGGYNMRVFRSRSPTGPYEDAERPGSDMSQDLMHTVHYNYGVKIMGSYKYENIPGETPSLSIEYLSPGHNSVYHDSDTEKYFLIYHQRFSGRGEYHEARVCEMFLNEDGWFVASPFRYDGGTIRSFSPAGIPGTWKLINHGKVNNTMPVKSVEYKFSDNGKMEGPHDSSGTWELKSDGKTVYITMDGVLYKGVFLRCYDEEKKQWVQAFTALSANGIALWGAGAAVK